MLVISIFCPWKLHSLTSLTAGFWVVQPMGGTGEGLEGEKREKLGLPARMMPFPAPGAPQWPCFHWWQHSLWSSSCMSAPVGLCYHNLLPLSLVSGPWQLWLLLIAGCCSVPTIPCPLQYVCSIKLLSWKGLEWFYLPGRTMTWKSKFWSDTFKDDNW